MPHDIEIFLRCHFLQSHFTSTRLFFTFIEAGSTLLFKAMILKALKSLNP